MTIPVWAHLQEALPVWASSRTGPITVATPYLTQRGLDVFIAAVGEAALAASRWLVDLSLDNAVCGSTEPDAVRRLIALGAELRTLGLLHAKVYLFGECGPMIIGSANLTGGGIETNDEAVALIADQQTCRQTHTLFDGWWRSAKVVTLAMCFELEREAARAKDLRACGTALMQLMGLGAFVTISTSAEEEQQQHSIRLEDVGVPSPTADDLRPTPPTLLLWPSLIRDAWSRETRRSRAWLKRRAIEYHGQQFLPRELFTDLGDQLEHANGRVRDCVASLTAEDWQSHRVGVEEQVRGWLRDIADEQQREAVWVEEKVEAIMLGVPQAGTFGEAPKIACRMQIPHPDGISDLSDLVQELAGLLREHPSQAPLPCLASTDDE